MKNQTLAILLLFLMITPTLLMCKKEPATKTPVVATTGYTAEQKRLLESIKQVKMSNPDKHKVLTVSGGEIMSACAADGICFGLGMAILDLAGWEPSDIYFMACGMAGIGSLQAALNPWNFIPAHYPNKQPYDDFDHTGYANIDNIYDEAGQIHNTLLDEANVHFSSVWDGTKVLYAPLCTIFSDKLNSMEGTSVEINMAESEFDDFGDVLANDEATISDKLSTLNVKGYDSYYCEVMSTYFNTVAEAEDLTSLINYSKDVEALVSSSDLSDSYKKMFLGSMSVFRYSYGYWNRVATK